MSSARSNRTEARMTAAWVAAVLALVVGLAYAAVSAYWATGATAGLDTLGGVFERAGRSGGTAVTMGLWAVVLVKTVAAVLPLLALSRPLGSVWRRLVWMLTWVDAVILTLYGLVLTVAGLLIEADVVHTRPGAEHRALRWQRLPVGPLVPAVGAPGRRHAAVRPTSTPNDRPHVHPGLAERPLIEGRAKVANFVVEGRDLVVRLSMLEKLGAMRGDARILLATVRNVRVSDQPPSKLRGIRSPGTGSQGSSRASPVGGRGAGAGDFAAVYWADQAVVAETDGTPVRSPRRFLCRCSRQGCAHQPGAVLGPCLPDQVDGSSGRAPVADR